MAVAYKPRIRKRQKKPVPKGAPLRKNVNTANKEGASYGKFEDYYLPTPFPRDTALRNLNKSRQKRPETQLNEDFSGSVRPVRRRSRNKVSKLRNFNYKLSSEWKNNSPNVGVDEASPNTLKRGSFTKVSGRKESDIQITPVNQRPIGKEKEYDGVYFENLLSSGVNRISNTYFEEGQDESSFGKTPLSLRSSIRSVNPLAMETENPSDSFPTSEKNKFSEKIEKFEQSNSSQQKIKSRPGVNVAKTKVAYLPTFKFMRDSGRYSEADRNSIRNVGLFQPKYSRAPVQSIRRPDSYALNPSKQLVEIKPQRTSVTKNKAIKAQSLTPVQKQSSRALLGYDGDKIQTRSEVNSESTDVLMKKFGDNAPKESLKLKAGLSYKPVTRLKENKAFMKFEEKAQKSSSDAVNTKPKSYNRDSVINWPKVGKIAEKFKKNVKLNSGSGFTSDAGLGTRFSSSGFQRARRSSVKSFESNVVDQKRVTDSVVVANQVVPTPSKIDAISVATPTALKTNSQVFERGAQSYISENTDLISNLPEVISSAESFPVDVDDSESLDQEFKSRGKTKGKAAVNSKENGTHSSYPSMDFSRQQKTLQTVVTEDRAPFPHAKLSSDVSEAPTTADDTFPSTLRKDHEGINLKAQFKRGKTASEILAPTRKIEKVTDADKFYSRVRQSEEMSPEQRTTAEVINEAIQKAYDSDHEEIKLNSPPLAQLSTRSTLKTARMSPASSMFQSFESNDVPSVLESSFGTVDDVFRTQSRAGSEEEESTNSTLTDKQEGEVNLPKIRQTFQSLVFTRAAVDAFLKNRNPDGAFDSPQGQFGSRGSGKPSGESSMAASTADLSEFSFNPESSYEFSSLPSPNGDNRDPSDIGKRHTTRSRFDTLESEVSKEIGDLLGLH
eukprot:snap_masked-scaffold_27-processed-gene-1.25-mRNA-1 protein AED:1.00 eAED:1.00 QI:0/-1/0/0/-1/1/1/0/893